MDYILGTIYVFTLLFLYLKYRMFISFCKNEIDELRIKLDTNDRHIIKIGFDIIDINNKVKKLIKESKDEL